MKNISFVYTQSCIYIFIRKELVKKKKKKELFRMVLFLFFFIFFYLLFIFFIHLFTFFYEDNNIDFRIFQRCEISFFFFFGNWKLRRNTRNIYIYNALLGLVFLSFIKLFSLYIHWLFFSIEEETWYFDCQCCTFDLKRDPTFPFVSHLSISLRDEQKRIREEYPNRGYVI